jgi:DNA-dependent RNA polymerase auxiliary subunit epsilon
LLIHLKGGDMMYFKVYYQDKTNEVPIRENTKILYLEGNSIGDIRRMISHLDYNVEYVETLKGPYLEYEMNSPNFKLMELDQL